MKQKDEIREIEKLGEEMEEIIEDNKKTCQRMWDLL